MKPLSRACKPSRNYNCYITMYILLLGRKTRVPKVKCFKEYKPNSCKKKMPGRFTFKDCCQVNRGAAYQIGSKRSKRKCLPCSKGR